MFSAQPSPKTHRQQTARRFRPVIENLENRLVPAVTVQQLDLDGDGAADDIRIVGDDQNNVIRISDNGANGILLSIDANGDGDFTDAGELNAVSRAFQGKSGKFDIQLGGGDDKVEYTVTGAFDASKRALLVKLGKGSDEFTFDAEGRVTDNGSVIRLDVSGGQGDDGIQSDFGAIEDSSLSLRNSGGAGDDEIVLKVNDNIDFGATVDAAFDLGDGENVLAIALEGVGFSDVATATIDIVGGDDAQGQDTVLMLLGNDVGGGAKVSSLTITASLLAGDDEFQSKFEEGDVRVDDSSTLEIIVDGGDGDDGLLAEIADVGAGTGGMLVDSEAQFNLELSGGNGNDTVVAALDADVDGQFRFRLNGDSGNDVMLATLDMTGSSASGSVNAKLAGGAENDKMGFKLVPGNVTVLKAVMDGEEGNDKRSLADTTANVTLAGFEATIPEIDVF